MRKIIKLKKFWYFVLFCLLVSGILIVFNLSQFKRYQLNRRNEDRKNTIIKLLASVESYIANNNNLPTTSNPEPKNFLPELLFEGKKPSGGVPVSTLENMQGYNIDLNIKDPSGSPYFVGTFEDELIIYTTNFEVYNSGNETYFESLKTNPTIKDQEVKS